jgi:pSer/pThr/pTyr-binding forkhead associated (FHA) protein
MLRISQGFGLLEIRNATRRGRKHPAGGKGASVILAKVKEATIRIGPRSAGLKEGATLRLGRAPANDIVMDDPSVSSQHAAVKLEQGRLWVQDLASHNGTFVNGHKLEPRKWTAVRSIDKLHLCKQEVAFDLVMEPASSPAVTQAMPAAEESRKPAPARSTAISLREEFVSVPRERTQGRLHRGTDRNAAQTCITVLAVAMILLLCLAWASMSSLEMEPRPKPTPTQTP